MPGFGNAPKFANKAGTLFSPACASITPPVTRIPERAVINPTASTFLTSSYVNVPPIETLPLNDAPPVTARVDPLNVRLPLSSSSPPVPARTTLPDVKSSTLNVFA